MPIPFEELEKILQVTLDKLSKAELSSSALIFRQKPSHNRMEEYPSQDPMESALRIYVACIQYVLPEQ